MKIYFVLYEQHTGSGSVRILGVYEDREEAKKAEEEAICNCGFFETVTLDEVCMWSR